MLETPLPEYYIDLVAPVPDPQRASYNNITLSLPYSIAIKLLSLYDFP